jgi:hypothetical protein
MPLQAREIKYNVQLKAGDLKEWDENPNEMTPGEDAALKASLRMYGVVDPPVIDEGNMVIGGNHRLGKIIEVFGKDHKISCTRILGLTRDEKVNLALALNKIHGKNNPEKLRALILSLPKIDDLLYLGFTAQDLEIINIPVEPARPFNPADEWHGMPEFTQKDAMGVRQLIVHFETEDDVKKFAELVQHPINEKTKYIWFPRKKNIDMSSVEYRGDDNDQ